MAKLVLVCGRGDATLPFTPAHIEALAARLTPDNIGVEVLAEAPDAHLLTGVFGRASGVRREGGSICAGCPAGPVSDWWRPGADAPDGTYALLRADRTTVELLADAVASRTIWYVRTERLFIASTSQRAVVFFLRDFEPEASARLWMISSGALGYQQSWDTRICCLKGGSRLVLDRASWRMRVVDAPLEFAPRDAGPDEHTRALKEAMADTFGGLRLDLSRWVLPLSGGMDSRAILLYLKNAKELRTITWGSQKARLDGRADGMVAARLAEHFSLKHEYFEVEPADEPPEKILRRFLIAGEGRIDQLAGYADGFVLWRTLYERGCTGIIRGDTCLNHLRRADAIAVYGKWAYLRWSDYSNLARFLPVGESARQERSPELAKRDGESRADWRDRFYLEYEIPVRLAPLNDLKLPYVEIANPLLSRRIVSCVRQLPEEMRTDKKVFRDLVTEMGPDIPFASRRATLRSEDILGEQRVLGHILESIDTAAARDMFSGELIEYVINAAGDPPRRGKAARSIARLVAKARRRLLPGSAKRVLNPRVLAFRVFIVCEIDRLLRSDAQAIESGGSLAGNV